ncbi:MAG: four helix bundle protein [Candidatus Kapabacteria bacterium]|nr:four helix bundle protein [Candidatus Kapabacteria bacterium]
MSIRSLRIYGIATDLSDAVSNLVCNWPEFHKRTLGQQIVRAADSISNNIAEGYGRVAIGERLQLYMYAEGSTQETLNCLDRALNRGIIDEELHRKLIQKCKQLSIGIIELANAQMEREPNYQGPFRERIAKRRAWRTITPKNK